MDNCYRYEVHETSDEAPFLPSILAAYVLTMEDSSRLSKESLGSLKRLCRTTVVQVNRRGKEGCQKPACTKKTNHDLVYSYKKACADAKNRFGRQGNILFLEDDAVIRKDAKRSEFLEIDGFIRSHPFDVYTLGSIGIVSPFKKAGDHHYRMLIMMLTQSTIWAPSAREKLLRSDPCKISHIDVHFLSRLERLYKFKRPLVLQLFPVTDNSKEWCAYCKGGVAGRVEKWGVRLFSQILRRRINLDTSLLPGWDDMNRITHNAFFFVCGFLLLVLIVVALIVKKICFNPPQSHLTAFVKSTSQLLSATGGRLFLAHRG